MESYPSGTSRYTSTNRMSSSRSSFRSFDDEPSMHVRSLRRTDERVGDRLVPFRDFDHSSVDQALSREREAFNEMQRELRQEAAEVADRYEVTRNSFVSLAVDSGDGASDCNTNGANPNPKPAGTPACVRAGAPRTGRGPNPSQRRGRSITAASLRARADERRN